MELTFLNWLLAASPVIVVLVLMLAFNWGGSRAGAAAWFVAVAVALLRFGAGPLLIGFAQAKSILFALDVLYIIWMALLLYHVADEAGAITLIGKRLPGLTADRMIQSLLLSWLFASFLQGMGGFGVPVAVVAPLLVGLGFSPIQAVVMASLGHGWSVTFGSLGTSYVALTSITGLPSDVLAPESAFLLGCVSIVSGGLVAYVGAGWKGLLRAIPVLLVLSVVLGTVQFYLATHGLFTLGSTGASLAGLVVGIGLARLPFYQHAHPDETPEPEAEAAIEPQKAQAAGPQRSLVISLSAYAILIVIAFAVNLIPVLEQAFNSIRLVLNFPEMVTAFGWATPAEAGRKISVFGHPGAILLYASTLSYMIYARAGYYQSGALKRIGRKVVKGAVGSSLGIIAMVGMATIMTHAGMTNMIARGLSETVSSTIYPAIAPFLGALGAFMTGSNTNSNVVFGGLQMETARLLGLSVTLILAGQTAGASVGSILAPAKVIVGCSTVGLSGHEGPVIRRMLLFGLLPVVVIALIAWGIAALGLNLAPGT